MQLVSGPRKDLSVSDKPVPPRALTGHSAWPVLGHTMLFVKYGGELARLFPPDWKEIKYLPSWCSRPLGDIFSVFIWGQWRVIIQGPDDSRYILKECEITEGWAWSPPVTLLGKSCLPLLEDAEAATLRRIIEEPLSQPNILRHAPEFAAAAKHCIDSILMEHAESCDNDKEDSTASQNMQNLSVQEGGSDLGSSSSSSKKTKAPVIMWDSLRSYTYSLIDGPVLGLEKFMAGESNVPKKSSKSVKFAEETAEEPQDKPEDEPHYKRPKKMPSKKLMLLWMQRLKDGLVGMRVTWGPRWCQCWRLNVYGQAIVSRRQLEKLIGAHVEERERLVSTHHEKGVSTRDPFNSTFSLIAFTNQYFQSRNFSIKGRRARVGSDNRPRTQSEPDFPTRIPSDRASPSYSRPTRGRCLSEPDFVDVSKQLKAEDDTKIPKQKRIKPITILDDMLRREDIDGRAITRVATTETCMLLWLVMDAAQAWTAMALHLISTEENVLTTLQDELDALISSYGQDRLYTSFVLSKMERMDALIHEAIRLCPSFLGGMKKLQQTVELRGHQIPKNTNIIFSEPTDPRFDLANGLGKHPEAMGEQYPSPELHGFLPFRGYEVPLLVLQTKMFLVVLLQCHFPSVSKRKTFVRKVHEALSKSFSSHRHDTVGRDATAQPEEAPPSNDPTIIPERIFKKVPFPEPRRVIQIHPRPVSLEP